VLSGYLVPFRSPTWAALKAPEEARDFGVELWRKLLGGRRPRLTFTIGQIVFQSMQEIFDGDKASEHASGWGKIKIRVCEYEGGKLIGLPHLSRFQLFSDKPSYLARQQIIESLIGCIG
jgi:hypothetical protein